MKRSFAIFAALFCSAVLFNSCQTKDPQKQAEEMDMTPCFVQLTVQFNSTQDMLTYTDMVVSYNDGTEEKQETITTENWSKTVEVKLPCALKFTRAVTLKAGAELTADDVFRFKKGYSYSYKFLNASGEAIKKGQAYSCESSASIKGDKVAEFISGKMLDSEISLTLDQNGER